MRKAVLCRLADKLRELFAILASTCSLFNPLQLWEKYKDALSDDIAHRLQGKNEDLIISEALKFIEDKIINLFGKNIADFDFPTPQRREELSSEVIRELSYDITALDTFVIEMAPGLLAEQR